MSANTGPVDDDRPEDMPGSQPGMERSMRLCPVLNVTCKEGCHSRLQVCALLASQPGAAIKNVPATDGARGIGSSGDDSQPDPLSAAERRDQLPGVWRTIGPRVTEFVQRITDLVLRHLELIARLILGAALFVVFGWETEWSSSIIASFRLQGVDRDAAEVVRGAGLVVTLYIIVKFLFSDIWPGGRNKGK